MSLIHQWRCPNQGSVLEPRLHRIVDWRFVCLLSRNLSLISFRIRTVPKLKHTFASVVGFSKEEQWSHASGHQRYTDHQQGMQTLCEPWSDSSPTRSTTGTLPSQVQGHYHKLCCRSECLIWLVSLTTGIACSLLYHFITWHEAPKELIEHVSRARTVHYSVDDDNNWKAL